MSTAIQALAAASAVLAVILAVRFLVLLLPTPLRHHAIALFTGAANLVFERIGLILFDERINVVNVRFVDEEEAAALDTKKLQRLLASTMLASLTTGVKDRDTLKAVVKEMDRRAGTMSERVFHRYRAEMTTAAEKIMKEIGHEAKR